VTGICFVSSSRGNHFMTELLEGVASVLREEGVPFEFAFDGFPHLAEPMAYVVIPHEFFATTPRELWPTDDQLQRTISFCVEMPGTKWFELTASHAAHTGAAVAINHSATSELRRRGVSATFFQLGYAPLWDRWQRDLDGSRATDVVYLGSTDSRRDSFLASYADVLWRYRTRILVPHAEPRTVRRPEYLIGDEKYALLANSKVLINLHRGDSRSLEWVRVLEAISNGCVVVSEHSLDHEPLRPGEHFLSSAPESLGLVVDELLQDRELLSTLRCEGYDFVRRELSLAPAARMLAELADDLVAGVPPITTSRSASPAPAPEPLEEPPTPEPIAAEFAKLRSGLYRLEIETLHTRRSLETLLARFGDDGRDRANDSWPADGIRIVSTTPAFATAQPRVSVLVPLFTHELVVSDALASVAGSAYRDLELLVCDDASRDRSVEAVERFLTKRPWLPAILLQSRVNNGPSRTRNELAARARGELVFLLDSDNKIYPTAIERLVELLDANPTASLAYAMLAEHTAGVPTGLLSRLSWDPALLRLGNYIDTMSLLRRDALLSLGGFCEDPRLTHMEDYDLWCRFASDGHHGAFLPEILGWYRKGSDSRNASAQIDFDEVISFIRERSPTLFAPSRGD
jgi:GT2 family glycosyltransferase